MPLRLDCAASEAAAHAPRGAPYTPPLNPGAHPTCCPRTRAQVARLRADRDRLRDELDARDTEVMQLQGQLSMLQAAAADGDDCWLSPLPDPHV